MSQYFFSSRNSVIIKVCTNIIYESHAGLFPIKYKDKIPKKSIVRYKLLVLFVSSGLKDEEKF